jgi:hypothetical protein
LGKGTGECGVNDYPINQLWNEENQGSALLDIPDEVFREE